MMTNFVLFYYNESKTSDNLHVGTLNNSKKDQDRPGPGYNILINSLTGDFSTDYGRVICDAPKSARKHFSKSPGVT